VYTLLYNERNITVWCNFPQLGLHSYQILLKLVNIWLNYSENQKGELFWNTVYTLHKLDGIIFSYVNKQITDNEIGSYIDCIYDNIVCVMSECASAVVPRTCKGFYKFWWDEELSLLKEAAEHANNIWRATGKPKQGQIFINGQQTRLQYRMKIREGHKLQIHTYTNDLHDALIKKNSTTFWKCGSRSLDQTGINASK